MAGGNIAVGLGLLLGVAVITLLVAYVDSQGTDAAGNGLPGCDFEPDAGEQAECNDIDVADFLLSIVDVSITGIDGAPLIANALYVLLTGGAFLSGVILLVAGVASTPLGGG